MAKQEQQGRTRKLSPEKEERLLKAGGPHRFQPGQSGNPGGRPRGVIGMARLKSRLVDFLEGYLARDNAVNAKRLAEAMVESAIDGNATAMQLVMDRIDGPIKQAFQLEVSTASEVSIERIRRASVPELPTTTVTLGPESAQVITSQEVTASASDNHLYVAQPISVDGVSPVQYGRAGVVVDDGAR